MLTVALALSAAAGIGLAAVGTPAAGVILAGVVGFSAAIGRLAFESIVQRDAPGANRGRAFAVFETRFQLAWALGAFLAVAIQVPGVVGFLVVGVAAAGTSFYLWGRRTGGGVSRRSRGRARGRAPRPRSGSARPTDR